MFSTICCDLNCVSKSKMNSLRQVRSKFSMAILNLSCFTLFTYVLVGLLSDLLAVTISWSFVLASESSVLNMVIFYDSFRFCRARCKPYNSLRTPHLQPAWKFCNWIRSFPEGSNLRRPSHRQISWIESQSQ